MRPAALSFLLLSSALGVARSAAAECSTAAPCVHAEPLWLAPATRDLRFVSDAAVPAAASISASATLGFRLKPAVVTVPAPSRDGRDVNALRHATDVTLGARLGIGNRLELTLVMPAGLYQRGAGIKGVTHQTAPAVAEQSLHDPRVGFGTALPTRSRVLNAKLRFELGLPLGNEDALASEGAVVASPSLALWARKTNAFAGVELGVRLRRPSELFGSRVGSQAVIALGCGYAIWHRQLAFAVEAYALPSLVRESSTSYVAAEWLASARLQPRALSALSFGLGAGSGLPLSRDDSGWFLGFGVPSFRGLVFATFAAAEGR